MTRSTPSLLARIASLLLTSSLLVGCRCPPSPSPARPASGQLILWHTFNPEETSTLNEVLEGIAPGTDRGDPGWRVKPTVIPFAHAQNAFLQAVEHCRPGAPDVFRAELPWLADFVSRGLLRPVPDRGLPAEADFTKAARALARYEGRRWAIPASLDSLALFYNRRLVAAPPRTVSQLVELARAQTVDHRGRHPNDDGFDPRRVTRWGFYVRADAYWFLPFLWAEGGEMISASGEVLIDRPVAIRALQRYRDLVVRHRVAPRPSPSNDYEDQLRRFGRGEVAMIINGPWATRALLGQPAFTGARVGDLAVAPVPGTGRSAPLSGHGYVVSRCSRHPRQAWRLVAALASEAAQARFARRNLLLPTLRRVLPPDGPARTIFVGLQRALAAARPRPQHPAMARIFDDFNPAVQAVVLGDATASEALGAVAVAWRRLLAGARGRRDAGPAKD